MKKKRHQKRILKLLRAIDAKLGEVVASQARLEALLNLSEQEVSIDASRPSIA